MRVNPVISNMGTNRKNVYSRTSNKQSLNFEGKLGLRVGAALGLGAFCAVTGGIAAPLITICSGSLLAAGTISSAALSIGGGAYVGHKLEEKIKEDDKKKDKN